MEDIKQLADDISANYTYAEGIKKKDMTSGFSWDDREQLFYGIYKGADEKAKSNYSTGELQTLVIDSACRVMGQMPSGRFEGLDDEKISRVIAANLIFHEYIIPNANSGGDYFTKQRQVNLYSKVYGKMIGFVDYVVSKKYTGPDLILVHPRRFTPQPGKYSIKDMDWCFVDTFVTKEWMESRSKASPEIWKADIIKELNNSTVEQVSLSFKERESSAERKNIVLRNYFTKEGDWVLYEAVSKTIIFSEDAYWPGIPLVEKGCIPVIDRYWDLCDYERGETPQKTIDALTRKYIEALDKSIDPTTIIDPEHMVMSSVKKENRFWFAKDGTTQEPRVLENSPQGLATFQTSYNIFKANLMSMSASTDSAVSSSVDLGFGKTPEALKRQGSREGARDSWDRYMQERFLEDCADMMMAVASKRGMGNVKIPGIEKALEKIKATYPEQEIELFRNGQIEGTLLSDLGVRYKVDEESTRRQDDNGEKIMGLLEKIIKTPDILKSIQAEGKKINWSEAISQVAIEEGIRGWDKVIVSAENPDSIAGVGDSGGTLETQPQDIAQDKAIDTGVMNIPQPQPQPQMQPQPVTNNVY